MVTGLILLAVILPSIASAAECTDTWTGPAEGTWTTAANWSAKHVPTETDVACIGSGKTVSVSSGTNKVGIVQGEGNLTISGSTLELTTTSEASRIGTLTMKSNAVLTGAGTLNISNTLNWVNQSTMSGSGSTAILSGATASTTMELEARLQHRTLVNEGTFTTTSGTLVGSEGGTFVNKGTFQKVNTGTTEVKVSFENKGTVNAQKGTLSFQSGGSSSSSNQWKAAEGSLVRFGAGSYSLNGGSLSGPIAITGSGSVNVESVSVEQVEVESGSLSVTGSATVSKLTMKSNATVTGAGTLNISSTLNWVNQSTMSGSGSTVILPGATASTTMELEAKLKHRTLVNEGTFTTTSGTLAESEGGKFENLGTFNANTPSVTTGTGGSSFSNPGTFSRTIAGTTEIKVPFENTGVVKPQKGTLSFQGGGSSSSSNQWNTPEGTEISFAGGSFSLNNGSLSGVISIKGSSTSVSVEGVGATSAKIEIANGSLSVPSSLILNTLTMGSSAVLTGAGTLDITSTLAWEKQSTMSGSGSTVLLPGATATTTMELEARLQHRTFVNEGTFTMTSGTLAESEGGKFENLGTFNANTASFTSGTGGSSFWNPGVFQRTVAGTTEIQIPFENAGIVESQKGTLSFQGGGSSSFSSQWIAPEGTEIRFAGGSYSLSGGKLSGPIDIQGSASVNLEAVAASSAKIDLESGSLSVVGSVTVSTLTMRSSTTVTGAGNLNISGSFAWTKQSTMSGSGSTVIRPGATGTTSMELEAKLKHRTLVNEGTFTMNSGTLAESEGARFENFGTFNANSSTAKSLTGTGGASFLNAGTFQRTVAGTAEVEPTFENSGTIHEVTGHVKILHPVTVAASSHLPHQSHCGDPVECASGNYSETQTDFAIGGRGVGLDLTRTYSAQAAATATSPGAFGYGWTNSFGDHLISEEGGEKITAVQATGNAVQFAKGAEGHFTAPTWSQDTLSGSSESGYVLTLPEQTKYVFSGAGRLESVVDRNGNETTLSYNKSGKLETVTDPAGRHIAFVYNGEGLIESVEDPMGHIVKYAYEGKNLKSVTMPGEASPRWQFKYDGSHRLTSLTDGRGGETLNEYDSSSRVISQTDPAGRTLTFKYEPFHTTITNKATGAVTDEWFTSNNQPYSITHGFGTASATTETFSYNGAGLLTSVTDGNGHVTTYGYDANGNRISEKDAAGDERKWTYNGTHDITSMTAPRGETTTIERDANGNIESASRPGPEKTTQTTTYAHDEHGQLESVTDPLERTWSYGYDSQGNRVSETDPAGDTETFSYDEDSRLTSMVAPRGNVEGAEPSKYETEIERDAQGRPMKVTDPLEHATEYTYDANGNLSALTDPRGHTTKFTYNADDEQTKVEKPNGAIIETGYDGAGEVTSQTDGNKQTTTYGRNVLEQPVEVIDPLGRKSTAEFDAAGNLNSATDPDERTTSYTYDAANRLTKVSYSGGTTPTVKFGYDADSNLTSMSDGTGESSFIYDQLGRLTSSEDGNGDVVGYGYDLASDLTAISYPNGKSVSRAFDSAGRLESVTDWLSGTTSFTYGPDSNLEGITFPAASGNVDEYSYDRADQLSEANFKRGAETLASLSYGRDKAGAIESEIRKGLPGLEEIGYGYDENGRLTKAGEASFEYDEADNLTKGLGSTNTYDAASQLETGTGVSYSYDKLGRRTKATPGSGPATSYKYDQAGNLISVERPEEGEVPAINESLAYDGSGLLASKASGMTTNYLTWDTNEGLPLLLDDGQNSYIYGPGGLPVEQISSEEAPTYLHHDQLGSTRLLTNASGEASATFSYGPYGGLEGQTGAGTTPMGFAGQYADPETGLQYLRARFYDPATAQFLTRDPLEGITREPYAYAFDSPLNLADPSGRFAGAAAGCAIGEVVEPAGGCVPGAAAGAAASVAAAGAAAAAGAIAGSVTSDHEILGHLTVSKSLAAKLAEANDNQEAGCKPSDVPNFGDPSQPPGAGWEWRGSGPPGSKEGSWYNPDTEESLHPDLEHEGSIEPHYDYQPRRNGPEYRVYPDGRVIPKGS